MEEHSALEDAQLAQEVEQQSWDPSVKALTEFPSVLANMDKNRSWTEGLGDAYVNREKDVMNAIQVMRQRARAAGNLESNAQQTVTNHGKTIVIEPANPQMVYVPAIRSVDGVRSANRRVSWVGLVSRVVLGRTRNRVWLGLRHRRLS